MQETQQRWVWCWVGKIPLNMKWKPVPVFLLGKFQYSTFHSFWKWTLSCITFRGEVVIDKCSFHKVISTLLFKFALPMLLFLLNRLIQKMKTLGYILGNPLLKCFFIPYPFFHFLLFKMLQESWDFFIAIPFKIHFQNLLREDLMESFSSSVGGS